MLTGYILIDASIYEIVPSSLGREDCISLQNISTKRFMRHRNSLFIEDPREKTDLFRYDSSFYPKQVGCFLQLYCSNNNMSKYCISQSKNGQGYELSTKEPFNFNFFHTYNDIINHFSSPTFNNIIGNSLSQIESAVKSIKADLGSLVKRLDILRPIRDIPAADGNLRLLQLADLDLMLIIHQIFSHLDIKYWLFAGTLLGAIRHKGWIPWDDDMDIAMLRDDYAKLDNVLSALCKVDPRIKFSPSIATYLFIQDTPIQIDIFPFDIYTISNSPNRLSDMRRALKSFYTEYDNSIHIRNGRVIKNSEEDLANMRANVANLLDIHGETTSIVARAPEWNYTYNKDKFVYDYDWIFPLRLTTFESHQLFVPHISEAVLTDDYINYNDYPSSFLTHYSDMLKKPSVVAALYKFHEDYCKESDRNALCTEVIGLLASSPK